MVCGSGLTGCEGKERPGRLHGLRVTKKRQQKQKARKERKHTEGEERKEQIS